MKHHGLISRLLVLICSVLLLTLATVTQTAQAATIHRAPSAILPQRVAHRLAPAPTWRPQGAPLHVGRMSAGIARLDDRQSASQCANPIPRIATCIGKRPCPQGHTCGMQAEAVFGKHHRAARRSAPRSLEAKLLRPLRE